MLFGQRGARLAVACDKADFGGSNSRLKKVS